MHELMKKKKKRGKAILIWNDSVKAIMVIYLKTIWFRKKVVMFLIITKGN